MLAWAQVEGCRYVPRFGQPTLIDAVKLVDEVIEALAQEDGLWRGGDEYSRSDVV
ncbi:MAG: hypothetical protein NNA18_00330 [Nitrospira sp.]|nr:hypothetical protein [Nitrospira sp.]